MKRLESERNRFNPLNIATSLRIRSAAGVLALTFISSGLGCRGDHRSAEASRYGLDRAKPSRNLVLITIDTLRADRVGVTGGPPDLTPALDALGRIGTVFLDATAHAPLTLPSHASILTGRYPTSHGVHDNAGFVLTDGVPTLATLLKSAGYHTAAFVSSFVLRRSTGLARGFDVYDDRLEGIGGAHVTLSMLERRAPEVARLASAWLATAPNPFFLWVHFYDPHAPYDAPAAFRDRFPTRPYDAEVATSDFGVATVLAALSPDRRANTIVIATGDHGESLGEHGEPEHGIFLYDATLHVPLIIQGPGVPSGRVVRRQVRHVDIMPSVLELLGVAPPAGFDGTSLVGRMSGERSDRSAKASRYGDQLADSELSYAESRFGELHFGWTPLRSVRDGSWKYIEAPSPELYDLSADPKERDDRHATRPETAAALAGVVRQLPVGHQGKPDSAAAEALRSLGYVSGRVDIGGSGAGTAPDPKQEIARYVKYVDAFNAGLELLESGRPADAVARFRALAHEFPRAFEAHQYLARSLAARGALAEAVREYDVAIKLAPNEPELRFDAARALADFGHFDQAFSQIAEGRHLDPESFYGPLTEGLVAGAAGQTTRAEAALRAAVKQNEKLSVAHLQLGRLAEARGDREQARTEYRLAVEGDPLFGDARRALDRLERVQR